MKGNGAITSKNQHGISLYDSIYIKIYHKNKNKIKKVLDF